MTASETAAFLAEMGVASRPGYGKLWESRPCPKHPGHMMHLNDSFGLSWRCYGVGGGSHDMLTRDVAPELMPYTGDAGSLSTDLSSTLSTHGQDVSIEQKSAYMSAPDATGHP